MRDLSVAVAAIDAVNATDPRRLEDRPLALVQGERCWSWIHRLAPDTSSALALAARAHHLRRWDLPRSSYPAGRSGYLRWRREQRSRHATELRSLLDSVSMDQAITERAVAIIQKTGLGEDVEVQAFEDAVCLTFLETEFSSTPDRLADTERMASIVAGSLKKMSHDGRAHALSLALGDEEAAVTTAALQLL